MNQVPVGFSHRDRSVQEEAWVQAGVLELPVVPNGTIREGGSVIVMAAHPDDEALGAAALLSRSDEWNCQVRVLLFSAGENSHPDSPTHSPEMLKSIRLNEFERALSTLNHALSSRLLAFADGSLSECRDQIQDAIQQEIARAPGPVTLIAPYSLDGHADHEAVGAAALEVGLTNHAVVLEYPIWFWHWAIPTDSRWRSWKFLPDPKGLDREALFACYPSQTQPLSDQCGDETILSNTHLEHFSRGGDTYAITDFRSPTASENGDPEYAVATNDACTASAVFDEVHQTRTDPWRVWESEYEIAKRETLVAHLPSRSFSHILEIGCSVGALTRDLVDFGTKVTAVDASCEALKTAQRLQLRVPTKVEFVHATFPFTWPEGHFDCVVLSETGFYLTRSQLQRTLERIDGSTPSRFVLVLCHWKGEIRDWPLNADEVHDVCLSHWTRYRSEFHTDAEYRLDIVTVDKDAEAQPERATR